MSIVDIFRIVPPFAAFAATGAGIAAVQSAAAETAAKSLLFISDSSLKGHFLIH
jgi:hypothetical protein